MGAVIASIVMAGITLGKGIYDQVKADKIRKSNVRPPYNIPSTSYKNLDLAQSMASRGFPQSTLEGLYDQQGQNQAGSINAILAGGGLPNDVNMVFGNTMNNNRQIAGQDAMLKDQNIKLLMGVNDQFGEQIDKQWQVNKYAPYADRSQLASEYARSANQAYGQSADILSTGFAEAQTNKLSDEYLRMMNGSPPTQEKKQQTYSDPYNFNWNDPSLYSNDWQQPFENPNPPGYEDYNQLNF